MRLRRLNDGLCGLVDQLMIVSLESDADHFLFAIVFSLLFVQFCGAGIASCPVRMKRIFAPLNHVYQTRSGKQTGFAEPV